MVWGREMTGPQSSYLNAVRGEEWNRGIRKAAKLASNCWDEEKIDRDQAESIGKSILGLLKKNYIPKSRRRHK